MTTKAEFNAEEWDPIAQGPALAGLIVIASQRGGTIRESLAMAKVYKEAPEDACGSGDLIGELVTSAPNLDAREFSSKEDMRTSGLAKITEAVDARRGEGHARGARDYRTFAMTSPSTRPSGTSPAAFWASAASASPATRSRRSTTSPPRSAPSAPRPTRRPS